MRPPKLLLAWSSWSLGSTQTRTPVGLDILNADLLSSSHFILPFILFSFIYLFIFVGQASREAHLHFYFKPGPVASSCSPHQPAALAIHGKCLPWWNWLHYQERRVAEEVRWGEHDVPSLLLSCFQHSKHAILWDDKGESFCSFYSEKASLELLRLSKMFRRGCKRAGMSHKQHETAWWSL